MALTMALTELRQITYLSLLLRVLTAIVVGGVLGLERGRKNRPAGLRTYMLVCLGSAVVMMTNQYISQCTGTGDPVRMGAQVISGIGFLGAGSIMVTRRNQIRGLTTAAGLWSAACVGLAIGVGFYELALLGGITIFVVLTVIHRVDSYSRRRSRVFDVFVELSGRDKVPQFIRYLRKRELTMSNLQMESEPYGAGWDDSVAFVATLRINSGGASREKILEDLRRLPELLYIEEL